MLELRYFIRILTFQYSDYKVEEVLLPPFA